MPHSQLHLGRSHAAIEAVAQAGLPGPLEPEAIATRGAFVAVLAASAVGGIVVALRAQWWQIWYDHHELCKVNAGACSLHLQIALTWLCLQTPTKRQCASFSDLAAQFQTEAQAGGMTEGARLPLTLALALHAPLTVSLLVVLLLGPCVRSRQARTWGYRIVAFLALLAAVLLVIVLATFLAAVPPYFQFAQHLVGVAFGRTAMQEPQLQAAPSIASVGCVAALLFDVTLACLAFEAGEGESLRWYSHDEVHAPPAYALHLAPFAAGGASAAGIYTAVPTHSVDEQTDAVPGAFSKGWRNDLKPLGRFQQWRFL